MRRGAAGGAGRLSGGFARVAPAAPLVARNDAIKPFMYQTPLDAK
ncbi:hypothetical protein BCAR13_980014 [Paraburkholderia caribensis]|nr:hypothetical protein BCAR13_980014 [Paraburkholderia caribensis]